MRVAVMGAGGYVGSRVVPALLADGHDVTATFRDVAGAARFWWADEVRCVPMQALDRDSVRRAAEGADAVVYLVHGLGGADFVTRDRQGAYNAAHAAVRAGAQRIVYLGGLVPDIPEADLSPHLRSRLEVERILTDSGVPTLTLRSAMILGGGSTSFEIMRQLSERMPVQLLPAWMRRRVEPVAVSDVVSAIVGAVSAQAGSRAYDIGSGERLPYDALLRLYATVAGLRRVQVSAPWLPTAAVSRLAPTLTRAPSSTVQSLVESLRHDMVCGDQDFLCDLMPALHATVSLEEAMQRALVRPAAGQPDRDRDILGRLRSDAGWTSG